MRLKIESHFYSTLRMLAGYAIYIILKVHRFDRKIYQTGSENSLNCKINQIHVLSIYYPHNRQYMI